MARSFRFLPSCPCPLTPVPYFHSFSATTPVLRIIWILGLDTNHAVAWLAGRRLTTIRTSPPSAKAAGGIVQVSPAYSWLAASRAAARSIPDSASHSACGAAELVVAGVPLQDGHLYQQRTQHCRHHQADDHHQKHHAGSRLRKIKRLSKMSPLSLWERGLLFGSLHFSLLLSSPAKRWSRPTTASTRSSARFACGSSRQAVAGRWWPGGSIRAVSPAGKS